MVVSDINEATAGVLSRCTSQLGVTPRVDRSCVTDTGWWVVWWRRIRRFGADRKRCFPHSRVRRLDVRRSAVWSAPDSVADSATGRRAVAPRTVRCRVRGVCRGCPAVRRRADGTAGVAAAEL